MDRDKRRTELHTLRRLAEWKQGRGDAMGPVCELELGCRAATAVLRGDRWAS